MGITTAELAGSIDVDEKPFVSNVKSAQIAWNNFTRNIEQSSRGFDSILRGGFERIGHSLTDFAVNTLKKIPAAILNVGMEYEQAMNSFQAVTRANTEEMARAAQVAQQLGADLKLPATSAGDAALAMTELAKGGLTAAQAMDAARGVLELAAAATIDEAKAAEITANALNTFGLEAAKASEVADMLAAASASSSAEITDIALSLQQAGASAAALKIPMDDLVTSIGLMANAGIKGSDAGTSLKTFLNALTPDTKKAAAAMEDLGIRAFDASGKFVGLQKVIEQAAPALKRMTDEQKQHAIQAAFGSDAQRAANIILGQGADAFKRMEESVNRSGAAQELAAAKTKGLSGAWEGLKSQLESIAIVIFQNVAPKLEELVKKVSGAVEGLKAWGEKITGVNTQLDTHKQKLDEAQKAVGGYTKGVTALSDELQQSINESTPQLTKFEQANRSAFLWVSENQEEIKKGFEIALKSPIQLINFAIEAFGKFEAMVVNSVNGILNALEGLGNKVKSIATSVVDGFARMTEGIKKVLQVHSPPIIAVWIGQIGDAVAQLPKTVEAAAPRIRSAFEKAFDKQRIKEAHDSIVDFYKTLLERAAPATAEQARLLEKTHIAFEKLPGAIKPATIAVESHTAALLKQAQVFELPAAAGEKLVKVWLEQEKVNADLAESTRKLEEQWRKSGEEIFGKAEDLGTVFPKMEDRIRSAIDGVLSIFDLMPGRIGDKLRGVFDVVNRVFASLSQLIEGFPSSIEGAIGKIGGMLGGLFSKIGGLFGGGGGGNLLGMGAGAMSAAKGIGGGLLGGLKGFMAGPIGGLIGIGASLLGPLLGGLFKSKDQRIMERLQREQMEIQTETMRRQMAQEREKTNQLVLETMKSFMEMADKLADYTKIPDGAIKRFFSDFKKVLNKFFSLSKEFTNEMMDGAKKFAESIGPAIEVIGNAVLSLDALGHYIPFAERSVDDFMKNLGQVITKLAALEKEIPDRLEKHAKSLSNRLGPITEALSQGIEGLSKLFDFQAVPSEKIDIFGESLKMVVEKIGAIADEIDKSMVKVAARFSERATMVVTLVGTAVEAFIGMADFKAPTSVVFDALFASIKTAIERMTEMVDSLDLDLLGRAEAVAAKSLAIFEALRSAIETFAVLRDYTELPAQAIQGLVNDMKRAIGILAELVDDSAKALDLAKRFRINSEGINANLVAGFSALDQWMRAINEAQTGAGPAVASVDSIVYSQSAAPQTSYYSDQSVHFGAMTLDADSPAGRRALQLAEELQRLLGGLGQAGFSV